MPAQERLVQLALFRRLGGLHLFAFVGDLMQRVLFAVVHGGGGGHRRGVERLHLISAEAVFLQPQREVEHVFVRRAGGARR